MGGSGANISERRTCWPWQSRGMEVAEYIASVRGDGDLLAQAAELVALDTPVPPCPGWRMRDLLAHLGYVHRWAAGHVAEARTEMIPGPGHEGMLRLAPGDDVLTGWFREGYDRLVSVLAAADPDLRCWTFLPAPSPLAFWARRQAHETAIHRADAQLAAASVLGTDVTPFGPRFAADGIDELLTGFAGRGRPPLEERLGVLRIRAVDGADGGRDWTVPLGREHAGEGDAAAGRSCEVSGPGSDVYLLLWNREPARPPDVRGDPALLATWRDQMRVRWS